MLPAASTLLDTVTMAARAAILAGGRLHGDIAVAPGDATGRRRQRQRHLLAEFCDQRAHALTAADRGIAILRAGLVDRRRDLSDPCRRNRRRARIPLRPPSRRDPSAARTRKRRRPCRARLRRWRGWRAPGRPRNSSVSPARALRRPMRIFWPIGAVATSSPAARASLIIGLVSGLYIQRAPRSNGMPNVAVSVRQRPPIRPEASTTITLRFAAMTRRAAAYAGSAGADHDDIGLARQRRGPCARAEGRRRRERYGRRQESPGASLSCHGFRNF